MKKKTKLTVTLILIALAFALASCKNDDGETHTHTYSAEWSKDATQHWHECTANDGAKTDIAPHTAGDWIIDSQATYDTDGSQHKECTVCGYTTDTETIAKFKTEQQLPIGSGTTIVNITAEYHRTDDTSLEKIQDVVDWFNLRFNEGSDAHKVTIQNLLNSAGNYKIVIDYGNNFDGFVPTNTQTLKVSKTWLDTNPTFNGNTLRNALNAMLVYTQ